MRLEQHRGCRREEDEAPDTPAAVPGQIPRRLAARHRMSDQGEGGEIEVFDERRHIARERIEIIAAGRLIGAAVAAAVEADAAEAFVRERGHLVVPHPARATEAIEEQDWRARSPLMPIELCAVFRCDEGHGICPAKGWVE